MKLFIVVVAILWGFVLTTEPALASCNYTSVYTPDGRVMTCMQCCYGGNCTVTCF